MSGWRKAKLIASALTCKDFDMIIRHPYTECDNSFMMTPAHCLEMLCDILAVWNLTIIVGVDDDEGFHEILWMYTQGDIFAEKTLRLIVCIDGKCPLDTFTGKTGSLIKAGRRITFNRLRYVV